MLQHAFSVGRNRAAANPLKVSTALNILSLVCVSGVPGVVGKYRNSCSQYLRSQTINPTLKEVLSGHHRRG